MNIFENPFLDDQDDDLKTNQENNDVSPDNDDIGENTEQTPLADAVNAEPDTVGEEGGSGWNNNKAGATNENKDDQLIPTVTPENDNGTAGPKSK